MLKADLPDGLVKASCLAFAIKLCILDLKNGEAVVPQKAVSKEDALLLVCIAGEIYAEIQGRFTGTGPAEWERILREVDLFREGKRD